MSQTRLNPAQLKSAGLDDMATDAEVATAVANHVKDSNPHNQYLLVASTTKGTFGLGNVDNTSDANKPVSTAQAAAITAVQSNASVDATTKANAAQAASTPIAHVGSGGTAHSVVISNGNAGFMSGSDKAKLDGIASGATANLGTVTSVTGTGAITSTGGTTPQIAIVAATTSVDGSMSAADKTKLDAISGTNTGDETAASIKTKLGITTLSGSNTGDQTTITGNAGTATKLQTARNINGVAFDGTSDITIASVSGVSSVNGNTGAVIVSPATIGAINTNQIGIASGVAQLDSSGKLLSEELPSFLSEFIRYANLPAFPPVGVTNKVYISANDNKHYRWINGVYVEVTFGWRDLIGDVTPRTQGPVAPTLKNLTANISEYAYAAGDKCETRFHIPHDYVPNTDIFVHLHWSHSGTGISGSFVTNIVSIYAKGHQQASFGNEVNSTITVPNLTIANSPQLIHRVDEIQLSSNGGSASMLDTNLIEVDGFILMTFTVNTIPSITGSAYTNEPYIIGMDIHYQSTMVTTKNKSPNFYI